MLNFRITILALLLLSTQAFAQPTTPQDLVPSEQSAATTNQQQTSQPAASTPATPSTTPVPTVKPDAPVKPAPKTAPNQPDTTLDNNNSQETLKVPANLESVNCEFQIPKEKQVSDELVKIWAKKAAIQSFTFTPEALDEELAKLKLCFTNEGWKSFQNALEQSGNLEAIKTQNLNVISMTDSEPTLIKEKDNQWKATIPMQITYQNEKDKLIQKLSIDLLINRKDNGNLGIMQVIATVRSSDDSTNN